MDSSIAASFMSCLEEYEQLISVLTLRESPFGSQLSLSSVQDELGRFKVWAGNIAAHKTGRSSLDFRLRDATPLRERIVSLLRDMMELLQEACQITSGARRPRDDIKLDSESYSDSDSSNEDTMEDSDDSTTELQQIFSEVVVIIDCLYKLSMSVRNGISAHDRLVKASTIDTSYYEAWDIQHVKTKYPATKEFLASRLGKSISRRRQYFKYCAKHHKKLAHDVSLPSRPMPAVGPLAIIEAPEMLVTVDAPIESHTERITTQSTFNTEPSVNAMTVLTQTTASEFVGNPLEFDVESDGGQTSTSYATSASFGVRLSIPPLPRDSLDGRPFECPYCYTIICIRNSKSWKKHIFRDLQPYTCTFDTCTKAGKMFDTRHDWFDHELLDHRKEWFCTADCQMVFKVQGHFEEHMKTAHSISSATQLSALSDMCHRPLEEETEEQCPLCEETLGSMTRLCRHLARHLEELALFALPHIADGGEFDDADSDKPQPSELSQELSNGTLSFMSNSLQSDVSSEADNVMAEFEAPPDEALNYMAEIESSTEIHDIFQALTAPSIPKLPANFLAIFYKRLTTLDTRFSRVQEEAFSPLSLNLATALTSPGVWKEMESKTGIGDLVLSIYIHSRKSYQNISISNEEIIWDGSLDQVRLFYIRLISDVLVESNEGITDFSTVLQLLGTIEEKLLARSKNNSGIETGPTQEESWAGYWKVSDADLETFTYTEIECQNAIHLLWVSEREYLQQLHDCTSKYEKSKEDSWVKSSQYIPQAAGFIRVLTELHEVLLLALENRIKTQGPRVQELSDLVGQWIPRAVVQYGLYMENLPMLEQNIEQTLSILNPLLGRGNEYVINDWLAAVKVPTVRIRDYVPLLKRIQNNMPTKSEEALSLQHTVEEAEAMIERINTMNVKGQSSARIARLRQSLVFGRTSQVDDKFLQLDQPDRRLIHEGPIRRQAEAGTLGRFISHAFLFDNYLLLAQATTWLATIRYEINIQPIPIALLVFQNLRDNVTSSITFEGLEISEPQESESKGSYNGKVCYPFGIKHLGIREYILLADTEEERLEWREKINFAKALEAATLQETKSQPFSLNILSNGDFQIDDLPALAGDTKSQGSPLWKAIVSAGPVAHSRGQISAGVNCAAIFQSRNGPMIAVGAKTGLFFFSLSTPLGLPKTEDIGPVTQLVVVEKLKIILALGSNNIHSYDFEMASGGRHGNKIVNSIDFFKVGCVEEKTFLFCVRHSEDRVYPVDSIKVLELYFSNVVSERRSTILSASKVEPDASVNDAGLFLRHYDQFSIKSYSHHLEIFSSAIVSSSEIGFAILTLESRQPEPIPRFPYLYSSSTRKRLSDVKHPPLGVFRLPESMQDVDEYFICVYKDFAVHINRKANVARDSVIEYSGPAVSAAVDDHFLLLFHNDFLEIRHLRDGGLCQIIAGQNIRLLDNARNSNVLFAMAHPDVRGRDLIIELSLQDGRVRTREHDAELMVTPIKTELPSHVVTSVLDEVQKPEAGTISPFSSVGGSSLGASMPSRISSRISQSGRQSVGKEEVQKEPRSCVYGMRHPR